MKGNMNKQIEEICWNKLSFLIKKYEFDELVEELSDLITKSNEELKEVYEKKIKILGGQAQKAKKYGGNVSNIEGQIRGIKWALHKIYLTQKEEK